MSVQSSVYILTGSNASSLIEFTKEDICCGIAPPVICQFIPPCSPFQTPGVSLRAATELHQTLIDVDSGVSQDATDNDNDSYVESVHDNSVASSVEEGDEADIDNWYDLVDAISEITDFDDRDLYGEES